MITTDIRVGDPIAYGRYHYSTLIEHGFSTVAKINKHGHIHLDNGRVFDKFGDERNMRYSGCHLMPVAQCQKAIDDKNARDARWNKIDMIRKMASVLHESGVDDETKNQLIELINTL